MRTHWLSQLRQDLDERQQQAMLRSLRPVALDGPYIELEDGSRLINLASNDYLGLAQHPHLKAAAISSIQQWGVGSGASRLITGHHPAHCAFEKRFARFKHAQAALLFPTGYLANLATITSLAQPGDLICADKLCHASLIDAARASGATLRIFPHLGYDKLRRLLSRTSDLAEMIDSLETSPALNKDDRPARKFILTDSIFSMDGDAADLPALCDIADEFDAILIVDEAHGTGVLGQTGAGLCEAQNVADRVDVVISTASKALGSLGGIVTASQEVIDTLINRARPFIYTTATAASQPAVINAALDVLENEPWRRQRVLELATELRRRLGLNPPIASSPIIPVITGSSEAALAMARRLQDHGFYAPAIRPPTVAPGSSRVRISLRADMDNDMIQFLAPLLT
jgi:8-amino-7-oxononanoate synthase